MSSDAKLNGLLAIDAATCALFAVLLITVKPIATLTDLPAPLLFWAGVFLVPTAAFMGWAARQKPAPKWAVNAVVGGNLAWVAASLALPLSGLVSPNAAGWTFLLLQAVAVAILAALEYGAASRSTLAAA